jgi:15-cis-phytoene synthase
MRFGKPAIALPAGAIEKCRVLTQQHSKTFYFGSRFFPPVQRQAVWAVYAACRTGDDIVDELALEQAQIQLERWWQDIERAYLEGEPAPTDALTVALHWAVSSFDIPQEAFHELYLGLKMDLEGYSYRTLDDLELYCRRVAGVVGWLIAPICGYSGGPETLERALIMGKAMQLTNILRDVGEDLERGRVYLPADKMAQFGVTAETLHQGRVTPEYRALMQDLIALARQWYAEGSLGIPKLRGGGRLAVAVAARAYAGILDALEGNDFDNFSKRAYVSGRKKLILIPQVWWDLRVGTFG